MWVGRTGDFELRTVSAGLGLKGMPGAARKPIHPFTPGVRPVGPVVPISPSLLPFYRAWRKVERCSVMTTIGLIGAGHIGSRVARLAVRNGHRVVISNSRDPETLSGLVAELGPNARAATALEAGTGRRHRSGDAPLKELPRGSC